MIFECATCGRTLRHQPLDTEVLNQKRWDQRLGARVMYDRIKDTDDVDAATDYIVQEILKPEFIKKAHLRNIRFDPVSKEWTIPYGFIDQQRTSLIPPHYKHGFQAISHQSSEKYLQAFKFAIKEWEKCLCVRFEYDASNPHLWLGATSIPDGGGVYTYEKDGTSRIFINTAVFNEPLPVLIHVFVHELGHALGLQHIHIQMTKTMVISRFKHDLVWKSIMSYVNDDPYMLNVLYYSLKPASIDLDALSVAWSLREEQADHDVTFKISDYAHIPIEKKLANKKYILPAINIHSKSRRKKILDFSEVKSFFGAEINLNRGSFSSINQLGIWLSEDTQANAAIGTKGDDVFMGGHEDNIFKGGPGDDLYRFVAPWGQDIVYDIEGATTLFFENCQRNDLETIIKNDGNLYVFHKKYKEKSVVCIQNYASISQWVRLYYSSSSMTETQSKDIEIQILTAMINEWKNAFDRCNPLLWNKLDKNFKDHAWWIQAQSRHCRMALHKMAEELIENCHTMNDADQKKAVVDLLHGPLRTRANHYLRLK